jgi:hypothetical protein
VATLYSPNANGVFPWDSQGAVRNFKDCARRGSAVRQRRVQETDFLRHLVVWLTPARRILVRARLRMGPMLFSGTPSAALISW